MKLTIIRSPQVEEAEVIIRCRELDDTLLRVAACVREAALPLTGESGGRTYVLDPAEVLYFESVDKRTFAYCRDKVCQIPLRLYEVEERFGGGGFFRAAKALIVNLDRVESLVPALGGRIEVRMENGERLMVSRQYVPQLKRKLDL